MTPSFAVGIAGGTGAGKTTLTERIAESVGETVTRVPLDNYYEDLSHLDFEERSEVNYDHPSAFEWDLIREQVETLLSGKPVEMPQYDFTIHDRTDERVTVEPTEVIVVEGIFALYDEAVREALDLRVYVEADADERILRRIQRDVIERGRDLEAVIDRYLSTVKPMHERYVEPTKTHADVIVPDGTNSQVVDLLCEKLVAESGRKPAAGLDG